MHCGRVPAQPDKSQPVPELKIGKKVETTELYSVVETFELRFVILLLKKLGDNFDDRNSLANERQLMQSTPTTTQPAPEGDRERSVTIVGPYS